MTLVFNKIIRKAWPFWRLLWKLKLDNLITALTGLIILIYNSERKKGKAFLCMERLIFNDDVEILKKYSSEYIFVYFPSALNNSLINAFWPKELQEECVFYSKIEKNRGFLNRLIKIYDKTLEFLNTYGDIDVKYILTANMDYFQDYPWIHAIHNRRGNFITLNKESILYLAAKNKSDYVENIRNIIKEHKFQYEGDYIFFYNKLAEKLYIENKFIEPNQSFVTGAPRVDNLTKFEKIEPDGKAVLCTFSAEYSADEMLNDILNKIHDDVFLKKNVIIKCKNQIESENIQKKYPDCLICYDSLHNHLKNNPVVFSSFNSTSCLDALICDIPVIVPWWTDAVNLGEGALLGEHTKDFHLIAYDIDQFVNLIRWHFDNPGKTIIHRNEDHMYNFLEYRYSLADGKNCKRFFETIEMINYKGG